MTIKFEKPIYVACPNLPSLDEYQSYLAGIWESRWLTNNGPLHNRLGLDLQKYLRAQNLTLFANGHLALECALRALSLHGEVITSPFTFASTAHAIRMNGLKPVFCDINLDNYTIDADQLENLINEATCAILPVHVYGYPCDVYKIQEIADKYSIPVLYDAAHAFGVELNGNSIVDFGDISMFSFHSTKVFHTIEGGALAFKDKNLKKEFDLLKNFGINGPEEISVIGTNAKMNEFQSAMGLLNLRDIDSQINHRKSIYNTYLDEFCSIKGLFMIEPPTYVKYNYSYAPLLVDEEKFGASRNQLADELLKCNIYSRKYFYPLLTSAAPYKSDCFHVPNAVYVSERILCLPIHTQMNIGQAKAICSIIRSFSQASLL